VGVGAGVGVGVGVGVGPGVGAGVGAGVPPHELTGSPTFPEPKLESASFPAAFRPCVVGDGVGPGDI
jgi:hypothetical protein